MIGGLLGSSKNVGNLDEPDEKKWGCEYWVGVSKTGGTMPFQPGGGGFGGGGGGFGGRPREMHKATCADCQKECEVPFKPSGDRPVYCKDCFSKRKGGGR